MRAACWGNRFPFIDTYWPVFSSSSLQAFKLPPKLFYSSFMFIFFLSASFDSVCLRSSLGRFYFSALTTRFPCDWVPNTRSWIRLFIPLVPALDVAVFSPGVWASDRVTAGLSPCGHPPPAFRDLNTSVFLWHGLPFPTPVANRPHSVSCIGFFCFRLNSASIVMPSAHNSWFPGKSGSMALYRTFHHKEYKERTAKGQNGLRAS